MPKKKQPTLPPEPTIEQEAGLGPGWQSVPTAPIVPSNSASWVPTTGSQYFSGTIAPVLQHDATFVGTQYQGPRIPSYPLVPPGASGQPSINAAAQSVINTQPVTPVTPTITGMVFKGQWTSGASYSIQNVVIYNLSAYVALMATSGQQPDLFPTVWNLLSENFVFYANIPTTLTGYYGPFDQYTESNGVGTTATAGPVTPAINSEVALWVVSTSSGAGPLPSGWNVLDNSSSGGSGMGAYVLPLTTTAPFTASDALGSSLDWATALTLFYTSHSTFTAPITKVSITSNIATVYCLNDFASGTQAIATGLSGATFLNGVVLTIITATPTQYTVAFTHANYSASDSGTATDVGIVQSAASTPGNTGTPSLTLPNPVTPGNTVIALLAGLNSGGFGSGYSDILSISGDVTPTTWTIINSNSSVGNKPHANIAFVQNVTAGSTVQLNVRNSVDGSRYVLLELSQGTYLKHYSPYDVEEFGGNYYVALVETTQTPSEAPLSWGQLSQGGSGVSGGVNEQTINYAAVSGDSGKLIVMNGSSLTLTLPSTPPTSTWFIAVENINSSSLTVSPNGLDIDGSGSSLTLTQNQGVLIYTDGTNYFTERGLGTGGSVTSVAMTGDGVIYNTTVGGSPITSSGTLVPALLTQTANTALRGPASGAAATPTFRADVVADLPTTGTWPFAGTLSGSITVSGTLTSSGGTIAGTWAGNPIFSGNVRFNGEILDGTGSNGPGDVLSSTGTGVAWVSSSTLPSLPDEVEVNSTVVATCNVSWLVNNVGPVGVGKVNSATVKENVQSMTEVYGSPGIPGSTAASTPIGRAVNTVYYNATGFPILVMAAYLPNSTTSNFTGLVGSTTALGTTVFYESSSSNSGGNPVTVTFFVAAGQYYEVHSSAAVTQESWREFMLTNGSLTDSGNISGSRSLSTIYQNNSTNTLFVLASINIAANTAVQGICDQFALPTNIIDDALQGSSGTVNATTFLVVPPGYYYKVVGSGGSVTSWHEYSWTIGCQRSNNLSSVRSYGTATVSSAGSAITTGTYTYLNPGPKVRWVHMLVSTTNAAGLSLLVAWDNYPSSIILNYQGQSSSGKNRRLYGPIMPGYFYSGYEGQSGTVTVNAWYEYIFD